MEPLPPSPSSSPPSGGGSPLQLEDCIEEVLKLTLMSSIQGKLHTGLSNEYCANLLRDDPSDPLPTNNDISSNSLRCTNSLVPFWSEVPKGVICYPLYKRLALSLCQSIHSGALCTECEEVIPVHEDQSSKNKDKEWNKLIVGEGSALLQILKEVDFELDVQEPFFSQLSDGLKTIEGRCAVGKYKRFQSGHFLLFNKCLMAQVQDVRQYASFHEMLETEGLSKVLPGVTSIEEGVQVYRRFYSEEKERSNGVLAICVSIPTSQLYVVMASILSGLSYSGIQKLLGFVQTIGTNPESLPPPSSTLLSTFLAPNNPDVQP